MQKDLVSHILASEKVADQALWSCLLTNCCSLSAMLRDQNSDAHREATTQPVIVPQTREKAAAETAAAAEAISSKQVDVACL